MKYVLVDVDTQTAFASPTGNLSVYKEGLTNVVLQNIVSLVQKAEQTGTPIIGSVDSHSYDAWEFAENGGPFPAHAVKGTPDWLKIPGTLPKRFRFVPMSYDNLLVGEAKAGEGNRGYSTNSFCKEGLSGIGLYFEKEVYSLFSNPNAKNFIAGLHDQMTVNDESNDVTFLVVGFCTGGFCVDAAAIGLKGQGYNVAVVLDATQAIDGVNGPDGAAYSFDIFRQKGIEIITTEQAIALLN